MRFARRLTRLIPLGLAYFAFAALAYAFTRFEGGFAVLWGASAILIAALVRLPHRQWVPALVVCGLASFGARLLWAADLTWAPYFVLVNLTEGFIGAWLMRQDRAAGRALESLDWLLRFVLAAGIAAPLSAALMAAGWLAAHGYPPLNYFLSCFYGHSLGNLTFTPLALLVIDRARQRRTWKALQRRRRDLAVLLPFLIATILAVFWHSRLPLLFLPMLPVMLIAFRAGREGTALSIAVLAVLGGAMTAAGLGTSGLIGGNLGYRLLFFQFYLATTVLTVLPVAADMQQRRVLHRRVRDSEARFRLMAEYSSDIIMKLEAHGRIAYVSPAIRQFGYTEQELVGRNCAMLIDPEHLAEATDAHLRTFEVGEETNRFEYLAVAKDGSRHWCEAHARMIVNDRGGFDAMLAVVRDIDERKRNEERLAEAALTDSLTGLPNRRAFRDEAQVQLLRNGKGHHCCIALFDIDHFKLVNDRHGHDAGDEVLRIFARIAASHLRKNDLIARLGGEEFAVIFPDTSTAQALFICDRLRVEVAKTVTFVGNKPIRVTVSGGVAVLGPDGIDRALKQADLALYQAKNGGRDQLALAA